VAEAKAVRPEILNFLRDYQRGFGRSREFLLIFRQGRLRMFL
jgi:hypothetical protein